MRNGFVKTLLHLESPEDQSLFERNVLVAIEHANFDEPDYCLGQAMEPAVLAEASAFSGISEAELSSLRHSGSPVFLKLKWLFEERAHLHHWNRVNVAFTLASIARYEAAWTVLRDVDQSKLNPVWRAAYLRCEFIVANRLGLEYGSALAKLVSLVVNENVGATVRLNAIAQAIVWNEKDGRLPSAAVNAMRAAETATVRELEARADFGAHAALSGYYRAKAMEPKGAGSADEVARIMDLCIAHAELLEARAPLREVTKTQLRKTYFESSIKEGIYVRKDLRYALAAAEKLVALDPLWSISWQQKADVEFRAGDARAALESLRKAVQLGSPRVPQHLYALAQVAAGLGDRGLQHESLSRLLELDPENEEVKMELNKLKPELAYA